MFGSVDVDGAGDGAIDQGHQLDRAPVLGIPADLPHGEFAGASKATLILLSGDSQRWSGRWVIRRPWWERSGRCFA